MPWQEVSVMDQRCEFVGLTMQEGANVRELCRRFGISPDVGYKWLRRWKGGDRQLADRSRRPHSMPGRSDAVTEERVLAVRDAHPAWGARKIVRCLEREGSAPARSTVHEILRRHGRVVPPLGSPGPFRRFEKKAPNLLWQMDFKGWVPLANGQRCHPLTVVDDHSRYAVCLSACANEQETTVRGALDRTFRQYGLPDAMFVDNGTPWGDSSGQRFTRFGVWLIKLGIDLLHSRPYHPQSRGKNERFHRTLKAEVFAFKRFRDLVEVQCAFDAWRTVYNPASQHPSGYVVEEKRLCWSGCDPAGYFGFCRARSAIDRAAAVASAARAKIHGPSGRGWIASISPASAASRSVLGAIRRSFAALLRLSHGSIPPSAGLNTGMR